MKFFMISVGLFVLASASTVSSGPMCGSLVKHPEIADNVGLTEEQRAELEDLFVETEQRIISSEAEVKAKQLEIDRLIESDKPDMRQIRKLVNEAGDARSSVRLAHIEREVRTRRVLKPGQAEKARKAVVVRMREARAQRRHAGGPDAHLRHYDKPGSRMRRHDRSGPHMGRGADKHEDHMGGGMGRQLRRHNTGVEKGDCREGNRKHDMRGCRHRVRQSL